MAEATVCKPYPNQPFNGQVMVDSYGVRWIFDGEFNCWRRDASVSKFPLANRTTTGLMSAHDKGLIDSIPHKGGGFGIIVKPLLGVSDPANPDGVIWGDVEFVSDSIDITCVTGDGSELKNLKQPGCNPAGCSVGSTPDNAPKPGFNFQVSQKFINSLCFEIPGCAGPKGETGPLGKRGAPGTGDGPQGAKGDPGVDALEPHKFTGIKTIELDEIRDTAIVGLELNPERGIMSVIKSRMRVPTSDIPADQVIASPIIRSIEFTDDEFGYEIVKLGDDPLSSTDVTTMHYPRGFEPGGEIKETDVNASTLSAFINSIVNYYRNELLKLNEKYDVQIREHIIGRDDAARQQLNILAEELANCEFKLPIETCFGISPEDCGEGDPNDALAVYFFGEKYKDGASIIDIGTFTLTPGVDVLVRIDENGKGNFFSTTLPDGDYVIQYIGGAIYDQIDSTAGYVVGSSVAGVGVSAQIITTSTVTLKLPQTTESHNKFDSESVQNAYLNGPILEKAMVTSLPDTGGRIILRADVASGIGTGEIYMRVVRFTLKRTHVVNEVIPEP
jgi:hypothetical protein